MSGACCVASRPKASEIGDCARCGQRGRPVSIETARAILHDGPAKIAPARRPIGFCRNAACDVLYFAEGWLAVVTDTDVRVGRKVKQDPIPLCYCFGFTERDVREEVARTGRCTIPARIAAQVKAGRCACEVKNPSGTCCLGEVKEAVKKFVGSV